MTKLRVHELAKELGMDNKELLDILAKKKVEVKSHMSTLEEQVTDTIRSEYAKKKTENTEDGAPKKKTIVQVFRPQNSKSGKMQNGNRQGQRPQNGNRQGQRPQNENRTAKPANQGQNTQGAAAAAKPQSNGVNGSRPQNAEQGQRRNDRPQGGRFNNNDRNDKNDRGGRFNNNDRNDRSDRNDRGNSRPQGRQGQGRREDRDSIPAPMVEQQKTQRNKAKDKEKDYKKKELRDGEFENKGKKGKKQKQVAEVKKPQKPQPKPVEVEEEIKQITIPEVLTIQELADKMKIVPSVIIKKLFMQGKIVTVNQEIDYETAEEIAMEFDVLCEKEVVVDVIEELLKEDEEDEADMVKRPPVVCVMGHVDHGKTSLLDAIRHSNVIDREAGGITQHIGASVVEIDGEKITFLDTPGHEAFTAMRMRGASSTDIAILVVAADDGVMPQTVEAINHAKAAGIEIIVAINKIDKPSANVERVKQELTEYELIPEDWGGSTIFVPVSAHTKEGIKELLEMVLLTAEVM